MDEHSVSLFISLSSRTTNYGLRYQSNQHSDLILSQMDDMYYEVNIGRRITGVSGRLRLHLGNASSVKRRKRRSNRCTAWARFVSIRFLSSNNGTHDIYQV